MTTAACVVCDIDGAVYEDLVPVDRVRCPVCRAYELTATAHATLSKMPRKRKLWVSGRVRRHFTATGRPRRITGDWLDEITAPELTSVTAKQEALLLDLASCSKFPGDVLQLHPMLCVIVDGLPAGDELNYHAQSLCNRGLLVRELGHDLVVSPEGWERVERLLNPHSGNRSDIFVAMSFADELFNAWDLGIKPAIADAGFNPKRVDTVDHNGKIDDRIMAGIRASYAIVVDVTTQNRGAYFEAGFALGLGRPVIWTVRADDIDNLHFDTRQFRHVVWKDEADLRTKLTDHLLAVFGAGPISS